MNKIYKLIEMTEELPSEIKEFFFDSKTELSLESRIAYANDIKVFYHYFKEIILAKEWNNIKTEHINQFLNSNKNNKEATIARRRSAINSLFAFLYRKKIITNNPVLLSEKRKTKKQNMITFLNVNEQKKLLHAVESGSSLEPTQLNYHENYKLRDYAIILLMLDTGLKASEIIEIDIKDVDLEQCALVVSRKLGKHDIIYFSNQVKKSLEDYLNERMLKEGIYFGTDRPLFVSITGNSLSVRAIQRLVKKYCSTTFPDKEAITPHTLRKSFAVEYYAGTKDIYTLQKKLGNESIVSIYQYVNTIDDKSRTTRSILEERRNV